MSMHFLSHSTIDPGTTVIVRAGLNVPLGPDGSIADDFRLKKFLPTLDDLVTQGLRIIILAHIDNDSPSGLGIVATYLGEHARVTFKPHFFDPTRDLSVMCQELKQEVDSSPQGSVFVLDNVREHTGEKENSVSVAMQLATLSDWYINDAFSVSHRAHMSMVALPQQMKNTLVGLQCEREIYELSVALHPPTGSVAVIGGNKFETKLPLIQQFLSSYHKVVVTGALANTLYNLAGYEIGHSVHEDSLSSEMREQLLHVLGHDNLYIPDMVVVANASGQRQTKSIKTVTLDEFIYDSALHALSSVESIVTQAELIVWNGPLGYYEEGYTQGTQRLLELIASAPQARSLVGGGNTIDAVRRLGYEDRISFMSTGGGAMIEFLTHGTLVALEALHDLPHSRRTN